MTNLTDVTSDQLQALKDFANAENKQLVDELEEILEDVAKTGQYIYPWHFMKPLYACKLQQVTSEFLNACPPLNVDGSHDEDELKKLTEFRDKLINMFDKFICAPFTIQRVSEMLTEPKKHYKTTAKFFRGLEKNILVVSTINPVTPDQRPVLKRSRGAEETPVEQQNGYVDTALKPQLKKIHLEETQQDASHTHTLNTQEHIDDADEEDEEGEQKIEECSDIQLNDATNNTPEVVPTATVPIPCEVEEKIDAEVDTNGSLDTPHQQAIDEVTTNSTEENDGLESMLVCNESSVTMPTATTTTTTSEAIAIADVATTVEESSMNDDDTTETMVTVSQDVSQSVLPDTSAQDNNAATTTPTPPEAPPAVSNTEVITNDLQVDKPIDES